VAFPATVNTAGGGLSLVSGELQYIFGSPGRFLGVLILGGDYSSPAVMPEAVTSTTTCTLVTGLAGSDYPVVTAGSGNFMPFGNQLSCAPLVWLADALAGESINVFLNGGYAVTSNPWCSYMVVQVPSTFTA